MKRKAIQFLVMLLVLVIPAISFAQTPPGPGDGGGPADAVPFDDTMNLVFLVAGIAFAMIVVAKRLKEWKKI
jgi:hypothetical protein